MRDNLGRFLKGSIETPDERKNRILAMLKANEANPNCLVRLKRENPYIFNSWRSILYTQKGKNIGVLDSWKNFEKFYLDVHSGYKKGLRLVRQNKDLPFGPNNFVWLTDELSSYLHNNTILLEYNNECLTILDWALKLNVSPSAIKNRYNKHKEYSVEEVLLGKERKAKKKEINAIDLSYLLLKNKASKMISSYRCKDKAKRRQCDLEVLWFITNILMKPCHYCGSSKYVGADRIDNNIGHIKTNVIPCCHTCNTVRNDNFSVLEMELIGKIVLNINKIRENNNNLERFL